MATEPRALQSIGRDVLGPAFCLHQERVLERTEELGLERLFFIAREGHLFMRVHQILADRRPNLMRPHKSYLYLSRLSTTLPSAFGLGARELRLGFERPEHSVLSVLRVLDLTEDAGVLAQVHAAGVVEPGWSVHGWWGHPLVEKLLAHQPLQREVASRAAEARALLRRYLAQENFFGAGPAALVDIGWHGTIQNNLARAFGADPDFPELRGIYFGLIRDAFEPYAPRAVGRKEGVVARYDRTTRLRDRAPFYFLEIFETAARAPHGTTLRYEERAGRVEPVLKESGGSRAAERSAEEAVQALQAGVLECANDWRPGALDREAVLARLERFVFFPTRDELHAVRTLEHTDDWGFESFDALVPQHLMRPHKNPLRWLDVLKRAYWKPGFVHHSGGPLLARLYHAYASLKQRPPVW
jgi:hypothetical protein